MKIAAIVGVKDEPELIGRCIEHLLAIGVTQVLVEDYGSGPDTLDAIRRYEGPQVRLVPFDEEANLDPAAWGDQEAALARGTGADWVLFLDADEFWIPQSGRLHDVLAAAGAPVLTVDRFNVPLGPGGAHIALDPRQPEGQAATLFFTRKTEDFRGAVAADSALQPWSSGVPAPKIAARPDALLTLGGGTHNAIGLDGKRHPAVRPQGLVIAHLPFTDAPRFFRKVEAIRETLQLQKDYHAAAEMAWHWKRWIRLADEGRLQEEFDRQVIEPQRIDALRAARMVESAAEYFARNRQENP